MKIGSLFSGIGGLELGLEWSGLGKTIWQVEKDEFCRKILEMYYPGIKRFSNVEEVGVHDLDPVDLICGGFPCQDISSAGKGSGLAGNRSGLWCEFSRIISELKPSWVVVENVASGANRWVDSVCCSLEQFGYETLPVPISAADVGAPHIRRRVFIIAHANSQPLRKQSWRRGGKNGESQVQSGFFSSPGGASHSYSESKSAKPFNEQVERLQKPSGDGWWSRGSPVPPVCGVDDGVPNRMDRLKALGNAVVPQCSEVIGYMIKLLMS